MENNYGGWQKNSFHGDEMPFHNSWADQEHPPWDKFIRCVIRQQSSENLTRINMEGKPQRQKYQIQKSLYNSGTTSYGQMYKHSKYDTNLSLKDGKRRGSKGRISHDLKHTTESYGMGVYYCQWNWFSCIYWCGSGQSSRVDHEVWLEGLSQSPNLNPAEYVFHLLKAKLPQEQAGTEDGYSEDLTGHPPGKKPCVWWCLCVNNMHPSIKNGILMYIVSFSNIGPFQECTFIKCKHLNWFGCKSPPGNCTRQLQWI